MLVFSATDAQASASRGENCILIRRETSPEDIRGMHAAVAVLTERGGITSHAAVIGRGMGLPCVVGASNLKFNARRKQLITSDGRVFNEGDEITVDGSSGEIIAGAVNVQKGDCLYGRYWGAFKELRHLHFNTCYYAGVEHCIEHGLARFEPGAGGDYKWLRGFDAAPTYSLHFLADPRLANAVSRFLSEERERAHDVIDELGRQSPLRKQPPAGTPRRPR